MAECPAPRRLAAPGYSFEEPAPGLVLGLGDAEGLRESARVHGKYDWQGVTEIAA